MKNNTKTIFREIFGDSPQIKVLDFLLDNPKELWTLYEIRDETKTSYATLKKLMPKLLEKEIVIVKKKVGKSNLYSLNMKNPSVKQLIQLDWVSIKQAIKKIK